MAVTVELSVHCVHFTVYVLRLRIAVICNRELAGPCFALPTVVLIYSMSIH